MRANRTALLGLTTAALLLVGSAAAEAQGKGNKAAKSKDAVTQAAVRSGVVIDPRRTETSRRDGIDPRRPDARNDRRDPRDVWGTRPVYGNGRKVPPGLAKKPGQMPPGQYKKLYGDRRWAHENRRQTSVIEEILRRR